MNFLEILQRIESIDRLRRVGSEKRHKELGFLLEQINQEHGEEGVAYCKQALLGYGLTDLQESTPDYAPITYNPPERYQQFFNKDLYQTILPLCQLAYLYEKNGRAEIHAFKLSTIFKDKKKIYNYLSSFKEPSRFKYIVHDACLFELPPAESLLRWKEKANQSKQGNEAIMINPRFRKLLPHADALDRMMDSGFKNTLSIEKINAKKEEIKKTNSEYKALASHPAPRTPEQEADRRSKLSKLASLRLQLQLDLAELCSGIPLKDADITILQAFYEKYKLESNPAHKLLIDYGISQKGIDTFYSLERNNDDIAIPLLTLDGKDIGYPGIYLQKLDTMSDQGAAIAACLGIITDCCQFLDGTGSECAIHGITSPDGGFYVVCEGDARQPKLGDPILAQSWTWRSQNGALCCDSIEISGEADKQMINDMYRYFGHQLCTRQDLQEKYKVSRINTGSASGISHEVGSQAFPITPEQPKDYNGYRDSQSQLLLADPDIPYLFFGVSNAALGKIITADTEKFFKTLFDSQGPLTENDRLKKTVYEILSCENNGMLLASLKNSSSNRQEELEKLITANVDYLESLNIGEVNIELLKQGANINAINNSKQRALDLVVIKPELLKAILGLYSDAARLEAVKMTYENHEPLLHRAASNPESLTAILEVYPASERLQALKTVNSFGQTLLHIVASSVDLLKATLELFDESEKLEAVKMISQSGDTVLHEAASDCGSLSVILGLYPKEERIAAVKMANSQGDTVLHNAASYSESLVLILELIPELERLAALKVGNVFGNTVLHFAVVNSKSLEVILESLPEAERLQAVKMTSKSNDTLLHMAASNPKSLRVILEVYPQAERLEALKMKNRSGETVLHLVATRPESLRVILESLPETNRFDAVKVADQFGNNILKWASKNPSCLWVILQSLPVSNLLEAMQMISEIGWISACYGSYSDQLFCEELERILALLPDSDRPKAVKIMFVGGFRDELAKAAYFGPQLLKIMLESLPEPERLKEVKRVGSYRGCFGDNILHEVARSNPEALKIILESLPALHRLEAVKITNRVNRTVLDIAAESPGSSQVILELVPDAYKNAESTLKIKGELKGIVDSGEQYGSPGKKL